MKIYKFDICDISRVPNEGFVFGTVRIGIPNSDPAGTGNFSEMKIRLEEIAGETIENLEKRLILAASNLCEALGKILASSSPDELRAQARIPR